MLKSNKLRSVDSFFRACENLSDELAKVGIYVKPVSEEAKKKAFETPFLKNIENIVLSEIDLHIRNSTLLEGHKRDAFFVKNFLKEHSFHYDESIFEHVKEGCLIEVYDSSFRALFKSLDVYALSSYSLADHYLFTWSELYGREEKYNLILADKVFEAFHAESTNIISLDIEPHNCYEKFSPKVHEAMVTPVCFASITNSHNIRAVITVNKLINIHTKIM